MNSFYHPRDSRMIDIKAAILSYKSKLAKFNKAGKQIKEDSLDQS